MSIFLAWILIATTLVTLLRGFWHGPGSYLTPPVLAAGILLAWFVPQAMLSLNDDLIPARGTQMLLLMANLSFGSIWLGWVVGRRRSSVQVNAWREQPTADFAFAARKIGSPKYRLAALLFVGISIMVQLAIQMQPKDALTAAQPSGLVTILMFLASINPVALFLALSHFLVRRNVWSAGILLLGVLAYAAPILLSFKRNDLLELGAVILFVLWVFYRWSVPRLAIPILAVAGLVALFGVSEIRNMTGYKLVDGEFQREFVDVSKLNEIDWSEVVSDRMGSRNDEFSNGAYAIDYITTFENPTFGAGLWNHFVRQWVPGQFVGSEFKNSLYIRQATTVEALEYFGARYQTGTTSTGFVAGYADFYLASAGVFILMSFICGRLWTAAANGSIEAGMVYMPVALLILQSLTHGMYAFFVVSPVFVIIYAFSKWYFGGRRRKIRQRNATPFPRASRLLKR